MKNQMSQTILTIILVFSSLFMAIEVRMIDVSIAWLFLAIAVYVTVLFAYGHYKYNSKTTRDD